MNIDCDGQESGLSRTEMRAIVTAIYNRVYQPGFENETLFPVSTEDISYKKHYSQKILILRISKALLFSGYFNYRMRITEAVFEKNSETLTLRTTPIYNFLEADHALWDVFFRMYASSPRFSLSRVESM